jgi:hypothetical protein
VTALGSTPKISAAVCRWMSSPARKASTNADVLGVVRQDPQLDLRVVGAKKTCPSAGTKPRRISAPSSVRIGMFCRFGSLEESRPVAATVWLNEVCSRPSPG